MRNRHVKNRGVSMIFDIFALKMYKIDQPSPFVHHIILQYFPVKLK